MKAVWTVGMYLLIYMLFVSINAVDSEAQTVCGNASGDRGKNGQQFSCFCQGNLGFGSVWGTDVYTDDSSICTAAVHAGVIAHASGGTVTIEIRQGLSSYTGSTRNGVTTANYSSWGGSYVFVSSTPGSGGGGGMEYNIDRPGGDYNNFDLPQARPELCRDYCANDSNCKAFTYVNPGVQGPNPRCWLKSSVPNPVSSTCCVSGVKSGSGGSQQQTFSNPGFQNGYRLDWCLRWAQQCGEPAASAWCRAVGYERASHWNIASDIGLSTPTYVMGDGRVCNEQFCDGFSSVTCVR